MLVNLSSLQAVAAEEARCACKQAAGKGCHITYPLCYQKDDQLSKPVRVCCVRPHLAVTARTVLGLALHSAMGSRPMKGSSWATRKREGVVMWGMYCSLEPCL